MQYEDVHKYRVCVSGRDGRHCDNLKFVQDFKAMFPTVEDMRSPPATLAGQVNITVSHNDFL